MRKNSDGFVEHCLSELMPLGPVRARAMFGGHGLYFEDVMFALIAHERLYMKVDELTRDRFEAAGCRPFVYDDGIRKPVTMSYWSAPEVDGARQNLLEWAQLALAAARRSKAAQGRGRRQGASVTTAEVPSRAGARRSRAGSRPGRPQ